MAKETSNSVEVDELVNEDRRLVDQFPKYHTMTDKYDSMVKEGVSKNLNMLVKHAAMYYQRNIKKLETPYPYDYPIWAPKDTRIYYEATGIDEKEFIESVLKIDIPTSYTMKKQFIANKSVHVIELMLIRQMWLQKIPEKMISSFLCYVGYSYYWEAYTNSFRYKPNKQVVEFTINTMSNRYYIKQMGSVQKLIYFAITSALETYKQDILEGSDYKSFLWVADRIITKFRGYVKSFAGPIYDNLNNKNAMFTANTINEEGIEHEKESSVNDAIAMADKYTTRFFASPVSEKWIANVTANRGVKDLQIRNTIQVIKDTKTLSNHNDVNAFFQAMFYIFLVTEKNEIKDIRSKRFIISMIAVYKRGNSNDKNVELVKFYLDKWLKQGSSTYRSSSRMPTINNFRKALFEYFVYTIATNS